MIEAGFKTRSVWLKNPSSYLGKPGHAVNENAGSVALSGFGFQLHSYKFQDFPIIKASFFLLYKLEMLGRLEWVNICNMLPNTK